METKEEKVERLMELSVEMLETLTVTLTTILDYSKKYKIPLPSNLPYLLEKARKIISELDVPCFPNLFKKLRPEDYTEPTVFIP